MDNYLGIKNEEDIEKILSEAYLNIYGINDDELYNPLMEIPDEFSGKTELYFTFLLSQPDFFWFTCKHVLGINLLPFQCVIIKELWSRRFPMLEASRGASKSFCLAVYVLLRLMFSRNRKIILCGSSFRQSKIVFGYAESFINNSSILRSIFPNDSICKSTDNYEIRYGASYARAIPIGDGQKIRGQRANDIICDEFSSMIIDIFETVIAGFAAVSSSPGDNVRLMARKRVAKKWNIELEDSIDKLGMSDNQIVIAGTTDYAFKHFYRYHKKWTDIIRSRGDIKRLRELFGEDYQSGIDWKDYGIIRIPYQLLPEGFMDNAQVARSKGTMTRNNFNMEFETIFVTDSDGFFKRSLIDQCTVEEDKVIKLGNGRILEPEESYFEPEIYGNPKKNYIYGIDPASKEDNFSIVILEDCGDFRKIVYVWVTNEKDHSEKLELGLAKEHNFYSYVVRKIRDLMRHYPCLRMAIDMGGGGIAVVDSLKDPDKCLKGELPLYPIVVPGKPKPTDGERGLHIIEEINFQSADFVEGSNHGLKKDFEDRTILFPFIDCISLAEAEVDDVDKKRHDNTLQQCIYNFEELKIELVSITHSETPSGRERWDTPETKVGVGRKGKMKKDRYSALLMANWVARNLKSTIWSPLITDTGGFSKEFKDEEKAQLFNGPSWMVSQLHELYE